MTGVVVPVVLLAAVLHAAWNTIAKGISSRLASSTLIGLVFLVVGGFGVLTTSPPAPGSWGLIAASAVLQTLYLVLLTASYEHGELSQVYPIARGLAVFLVALVSTLFLGETLSGLQLVGVVTIGASLLSLAFVKPESSKPLGIYLAVLTGMCIAAYSLVDGEGVRASGSTLGYAAWLFLFHGLLTPIVCLVLSKSRRTLIFEVKEHWKLGSIGGILSVAAYTLVVWAQNIAPLALVSALRETSVLLAGVLGYFFFRERLTVYRAVLTLLAVVGIVVLQVG